MLRGNSKLVDYASSATEDNVVSDSEFNITFINTNIGFAEGASSKELVSTMGTNRVGYSPPFIVSSDPSVIYCVNTTVVSEIGYRRIEFAKIKIYTNS